MKGTFSLDSNVIIKNELPPFGIVCSNPQRAHRLANQHLTDPQHEHLHPLVHSNAWGIEIYTDVHPSGLDYFIATLPMGAAGSALAFHEMFVAGAKFLVRFGTNDRQVTEADLTDIVVVGEADNLFGLMRDLQCDESTWGKPIPASPLLIEMLEASATSLGWVTVQAVCHNVEDYHSLAFIHHLPDDVRQQRINDVASVESRVPNLRQCWDMESAALFLKANMFGCHAAAVLQNVIKREGKVRPYEGNAGKIALEMEEVIMKIITNAFHWLYERRTSL